MLETQVRIDTYIELCDCNRDIVVDCFCRIIAHCCVYTASDDYTGQTLSNPRLVISW